LILYKLPETVYMPLGKRSPEETKYLFFSHITKVPKFMSLFNNEDNSI